MLKSREKRLGLLSKSVSPAAFCRPRRRKLSFRNLPGAAGSAAVLDKAKEKNIPVIVVNPRAPNTDALAKPRSIRKPGMVITHTEAEKGLSAYYATAYENSRGERGSWSPVEEAVIA